MKQYLTRPDGTIPSNVDVAALLSAGVRIVRPTEPTREPGMVMVEGEPEERDGTWWQTWTSLPAPPPEVDPAEVRAQRNALLAACDWTQLPDAPVNRTAWARYRQNLRDITSQPSFPFAVNWPVQPE